MSPAAVLAIDGGGIRGIIPAIVLAELEQRAGRPVAEMFRLVAGTSTGGIIALALTRPGADGQPAWTAEQLVELYRQEGARIFESHLKHSMRAMYGLFAEKYEAMALEELLERYCGGSTLAQSVTDVLVPAYEVVNRRLFYFDSAAARRDPSHDFPADVAARATSAAPTYFEPPAVAPELVFIDGGVWANNPSMCAFVRAQTLGLGPDVLLVSLGTGDQTRALRYEQVRHWGLAEWARPLLHVVLDGASMAIHEQLATILGPERYSRLQVTLTQASDDLDDARPENIARLERHARELIADRSAELDRLVKLLTTSPPPGKP